MRGTGTLVHFINFYFFEVGKNFEKNVNVNLV